MKLKKTTSRDGSSEYIEHHPFDQVHKICSIYPKSISLEDNVVAPGTTDDQPNVGEVGGVKYAFVNVHPKMSRRFIGGGTNDKWEVRSDVSAYDHARDLVGYVFSDNADEPAPSRRSKELEGRGLFVPVGENPTAAEMKAAQDKQKAFFKERVQFAQGYWKEHRKMDNISELEIIAAELSGGKYEWLSGDQALEKKSDAEILAEAIAKLVPALQQAQAAPAPAPQRK